MDCPFGPCCGQSGQGVQDGGWAAALHAAWGKVYSCPDGDGPETAARIYGLQGRPFHCMIGIPAGTKADAPCPPAVRSFIQDRRFLCISKKSKIVNLEAVSYTHLDVYKRQDEAR